VIFATWVFQVKITNLEGKYLKTNNVNLDNTQFRSRFSASISNDSVNRNPSGIGKKTRRRVKKCSIWYS
jgi:hypothetical protein